MAESTHSIYKSKFLQGKHSIDKEDHLKNITLFFNYYNDNRFPFEFYGLTPMEVLKGEKPDKTKYREQIKNAQKERLDRQRQQRS
jgi:pyruvate-formate lyase-activating enzyme